MSPPKSPLPTPRRSTPLRGRRCGGNRGHAQKLRPYRRPNRQAGGGAAHPRGGAGNVIFEQYIEKENEVLSAVIQRVEKRNVFLELGRTEGLLPAQEHMPGEEYNAGDRIKVYVLEVKEYPQGRPGAGFPYPSRPGQAPLRARSPRNQERRGPNQVHRPGGGLPHQDRGLLLRSKHRSRGRLRGPAGHPGGTGGGGAQGRKNRYHRVEPGSRSIHRQCPKPGAGHDGSGQRGRACRSGRVPDNQLSLSIGKEGQNARLAAKLTGWKIDIKSQSQVTEMMAAQDEASDEALQEDE